VNPTLESQAFNAVSAFAFLAVYHVFSLVPTPLDAGRTRAVVGHVVETGAYALAAKKFTEAVFEVAGAAFANAAKAAVANMDERTIVAVVQCKIRCGI
jgi:hypothetical protein